jgi:hypothetical protein
MCVYQCEYDVTAAETGPTIGGHFANVGALCTWPALFRAAWSNYIAERLPRLSFESSRNPSHKPLDLLDEIPRD